MPCAVCGAPPRNEPHHEPKKALGGGGDWHDRKTIPLCTWCHTFGPHARHTFGQLEDWERHVEISVTDLIQRLNAAYDLIQTTKP